jgi:hypothetical protein
MAVTRQGGGAVPAGGSSAGREEVPPGGGAAAGALVWLIAVAMALSAALVFAIQPMAAKALLPGLGGAPAVWTTSLAFFQLALCGGYIAAHAGGRVLGTRALAATYLVALASALPFLPSGSRVGWDPPAEANPSWALFGHLVSSLGWPLLAASTTTPLLQQVFAGTSHPRARDPFFLFAASNAGSLGGLLAYPLVIEPALPLDRQFDLWRRGFLVLIGLAAAVAVASWAHRGGGGSRRLPVAPEPPQVPAEIRSPWQARASWVGLALVPSWLTVAVTGAIASDVVSVPLLWVVPLALYLLTFVVAFGNVLAGPAARLARWLPGLAALALVAHVSNVARPTWALMVLHLVAFLSAALRCHLDLARRRPEVPRLTEFYLCQAAGGLAGGLWAALVAPVVFRTSGEYPLGLALALAAGSAGTASGAPAAPVGWRRAVLTTAGLAALTVGLATAFGVPGGSLAHGLLVVGLPVAAALALGWRRASLRAAGVVAAALPVLVAPRLDSRIERVTRSFFGVRTVWTEPSPAGAYRVLVDGRNIQGVQAVAGGARLDPLISYHRSGPLGDVFRLLDRRSAPRRVAVVGLGVGALACYNREGDHTVFLEIDPTIAALAADPALFTYLRDCPGTATVQVGDGRLLLRRAQGPFDLVVIDAFVGGAVPAHLVTLEAFRAYLDRLAPHGLIAVHLSSHFVDLEAVVAAAARALGLEGRVRTDGRGTGFDPQTGWAPSSWAVLARGASALDALPEAAGWRRLERVPGIRPWTDQFSSLWQVVRVRR